MTDNTGGPCRLARPDEIEIVREIQRAASCMFLETSYPEAAGDPVDDVETLAAAQDNWWLWVTVDADDRPVGAAHLTVLGDGLHIRELDVHPDFSGRKRAVGLISAVRRFFGGRGLSRLTLTTFKHVPWNAPYYARIGFVPVADGNLSGALAAALSEEGTRFPADSRIAMEMRLRA